MLRCGLSAMRICMDYILLQVGSVPETNRFNTQSDALKRYIQLREAMEFFDIRFSGFSREVREQRCSK